jgi:transcriptional regulator with XRE-family HTH domain
MTKYTALGSPTQVVRKCHECGGKFVGKRQSYKYEECGLTNVRLSNILVFECSCGVRVPEIPSISELHCLIALDLLRKPSLLVGEEVRFLRKMAGLSQRELAELMGVTPTRPSKWENAAPSKEGDRLLRTICLLGMIQNMDGDKGITLIQKLAADMREVLKTIKYEEEQGPKKLECENDPTAGMEHGGWFLPSLGEHRLAIAN